jgi:hypothetical protein
MSLSTEFLAPLIGTDPDSGPDRRTTIFVTVAPRGLRPRTPSPSGFLAVAQPAR